jgi:hypothetical protein
MDQYWLLMRRKGDGAMAILNVALEEGFEDDTVVVEVNGRQVFEGDAVTTRMQIGLAKSFEVPVQGQEAVVEVRVPSRRVSGRLERPVADRLYVGVSLQDDKIVFRTSEEPFGYL